MNEAYEELKPHLRVVLRSKVSQGEKLDNTIHTELCDMALLPVIQIKAERDDNGEEVKMIGYIKKNICEKMDVSEKQIMEDALNNTIVVYPPHVETMLEFMARQMGIAASEFGMDTADAHMVISTNIMYNNGATVIAYPGFLDEMAERLKDNLIIIPSSIHEVIVLRESEINDDAPIGEYIRDVNKSCMEQSEILSDHAYRYDAALKKLEILEG